MSEAATESWLSRMSAGDMRPPLRWFGERFGFLQRALGQGQFRRDAAIVPAVGERSKLASVEIDGGRDVKYAVVFARDLPESSRPGIRETVTYRRDVASTDVIYDLTGEFLQGKARPFVCDLWELPLRVFAVLPFQMEGIDLAAQQQVLIPTVPASSFGFEMPARLRFLDGAGEMIMGRLPYYVEVKHLESDVVGGMYLATRSEDGYPKGFRLPVKNRDGRWALTVRSLLTGDEAILPFEVSHVSGRLNKSDIELTSDGLRFRRDPQPVG